MPLPIAGGPIGAVDQHHLNLRLVYGGQRTRPASHIVALYSVSPDDVAARMDAWCRVWDASAVAACVHLPHAVVTFIPYPPAYASCPTKWSTVQTTARSEGLSKRTGTTVYACGRLPRIRHEAPWTRRAGWLRDGRQHPDGHGTGGGKATQTVIWGCYSPKCVEQEFSEVAPASGFCYLGCKRSGGGRGERRKLL